ncbi:MAG: polysaccharide pyruvyl transferase family protein [Nitrospirota bacterium]
MKIVITGNYGAGNIGDEMILEGLMNAINNSTKDAKITVLRGDEKFPSGPRSLIKSLFKSERKTKKLVKECDYFILGGGGLFGSLTLKANIIWGVQALMAYFYKKPVIMYGQSVGELKGKFRKWLVKYIFQKAKLITVRDQESKRRLKLLGITKKIHVIPDLAFNISYKPNKRSRKSIILALRQHPGIKKKFITTIAKYLNWIIEEKNYDVDIINFQEPPSKDADEILHEKVIEEIRNKSKVKIIPTPDNTKQLFDVISNSSLLLGMRLHSIISAIKAEKPFLALSYAPKVKDMLNYAGLELYMLDAEKIESYIQLTKTTESILRKAEKIKKDLEETNKLFLEKHREFEKNILSKIFST